MKALPRDLPNSVCILRNKQGKGKKIEKKLPSLFVLLHHFPLSFAGFLKGLNSLIDIYLPPDTAQLWPMWYQVLNLGHLGSCPWKSVAAAAVPGKVSFTLYSDSNGRTQGKKAVPLLTPCWLHSFSLNSHCTRTQASRKHGYFHFVHRYIPSTYARAERR